jgi:hypothetical protein
MLAISVPIYVIIAFVLAIRGGGIVCAGVTERDPRCTEVRTVHQLGAAQGRGQRVAGADVAHAGQRQPHEVEAEDRHVRGEESPAGPPPKLGPRHNRAVQTDSNC